jgi:hypothetical protein
MTIPHSTGTITVTAVKFCPHDRIILLATRDHSHHRHGTYRWDPVRRALHAGHHFLTEREARADYEQRT